MMITMLIVFAIGGQNFERHEPMPNCAHRLMTTSDSD
jgi:hypothetical protein